MIRSLGLFRTRARAGIGLLLVWLATFASGFGIHASIQSLFMPWSLYPLLALYAAIGLIALPGNLLINLGIVPHPSFAPGLVPSDLIPTAEATASLLFWPTVAWGHWLVARSCSRSACVGMAVLLVFSAYGCASRVGTM